MRAYYQPFSLVAGATIALVAAQPAYANSIQIADVQLQRGEDEFQIILSTTGGSDRVQVVKTEQGNSLIADIPNSQIQVNGNTTGFRTASPAPGIASVELKQGTQDTTRLVVTGVSQLPVGQIRQAAPGQIVIGFTSAVAPDTTAQSAAIEPPAFPTVTAAPAAIPPAISEPVTFTPTVSSSAESSTTEPSVEVAVRPATTVIPTPDPNASASPQPTTATNTLGQSAVVPLSPQSFEVAQSTPRSDVLVPNPDITIDGAPALPAAPLQPDSPAPAYLPQGVAPPVGPILTSGVGIATPLIDLGSNLPVYMRVDDAQVDTVLQSLANLADMNLIVADGSAGDAAGGAGGGTEGRISLELQGESLQDAFNYVLLVSGLDASRRGRTILVGASLPAQAKNLINRTFRINQASAENVASYLATQGAETQFVFQEEVDIPNPETSEVIRTELGRPSVDSLSPAADNNAYLPLRGLSVTSDSRLNTVSVTGEPHLVQTAANFIRQLDARVRQVAVNVKIIDINLQNIGRFGTSFSFGINEAGFINQGGIGLIQFGDGRDQTPFVPSGLTNTAVGNAPVGAGNGGFPDLGDFIGQLQATLENNNAKILTDPTLVVQEGQTATVQLTQEVVTDINVERDVSDGVTTITTTTETEDVGLILSVDVGRIDDNGFVTLGVNPTVTAVGNTQTINSGGASNTIALVNRRQLASGTIRMRDGQTLVLSGIIQDQDTVSTAKIPILGDIPIIGTLFRRTSRDNQRREVIVLVTPNLIDDAQPFGYSYVRAEDQRAPGLPQLR